MNNESCTNSSLIPDFRLPNGTPIFITEASRLTGHKVLLIAGRAWQEMIDEGTLDEQVIPFDYYSSVIAAHATGPSGLRVVSFIIWSKHHEHAVWINCSYTLPDFRQMGLHNLLFERLKRSAASKGAHMISSGTHIMNTRMQDIYRAQGRVARSINYDYHLTAAELAQYKHSEDKS